jgi:8-oxo-dGTP diphosphatase
VVYTSEYPIFSVTVDVVCLTVRQSSFQVLLVERGGEPFKGQLAFPGGFAEIEEDLETAARRELKEETGLDAPYFLEQLATYGDPGRDPRGRTVSVAHLVISPDLREPVGGSDAAAAGWYDVSTLLADESSLAFDHHQILTDAVDRARSKLEWSPLAPLFCRPEFSVGELRRVYETIWGVRLDPANFHRKVTRAEDFLVETGEQTDRAGGRPAKLYRRGSADRIHPPLNLRATGDRPRPQGT